mmetsp:Transcript_22869/g.54194  ORF Transcript_22869/g.54194 Transcript_22869/m.54194 type:complete len:366 (-) Transcript_22869:4194-5291(-)
MATSGAAFDTATTAGITSFTMSNPNHDNTNNSKRQRSRTTPWLGDVYRAVILILGWGGIVLSILASVSTCEFLKYQIATTTAVETTMPSSSSSSQSPSSSSRLDSPFDGTITGWVGIFQFSILEFNTNETDERTNSNSNSNSDSDSDSDNSSNSEEALQAVSSSTSTTTNSTNSNSTITQMINFNIGECVWYERQFVDAPNAFVIASQFCAIIAPSIAFIAMLITTIESCCFSGIFRGSFVTTSILLLLAAFIQSLTFLIFAEPTFCFNNNGCGVGLGGIYSACAACAFFMACLLFCCSPIPVPCLARSSYSSSRKNNSSNNNDNNNYMSGKQPQDEPLSGRMQENLEDPEETAPTITAKCTPTT